MPLTNRPFNHSVTFDQRKFNQEIPPFLRRKRRQPGSRPHGAAPCKKSYNRNLCDQTVNRLLSSGTSTVPTTATPAPAISCIMAN